MATRRLLTCPEKRNVIRESIPPQEQALKNSAKEKVMAFVVVGILAAIAAISLAVGLLIRKKPGNNAVPTPIFSSALLPENSSMVPSGEAPFSNPRIHAITKRPEDRYALYFEWIRRNKWWTKKLSKQELADIIGKGMRTGRGGVIWGKKDGVFVFQTKEECPDPEKVGFPGHPDLRDEEYFHAKLDEFEDPDKDRVVTGILLGLDFAIWKEERLLK